MKNDVLYNERGMGVRIEYKKKAVKYINSCDKSVKQRLKESFTYADGTIIVNEIASRGQVYKRL